MKRTAERYIFDYVSTIIGYNTHSLRQIFEYSKESKELHQLLPLLMLVSGDKERIINKMSYGSITRPKNIQNLSAFVNVYKGDNQVWNDFIFKYKEASKNKYEIEKDKLRSIIAKKIIEKNISKYFLAKSLKINIGNFNGFMNGKNGLMSVEKLLFINQWLSNLNKENNNE